MTEVRSDGPRSLYWFLFCCYDMIKRYERGSLSKLIFAHGSREIQVHGGRVVVWWLE